MHKSFGMGRPKGASNKRSAELRERLVGEMKHRYGIDNYDPVICLAEIACDVSNPLEVRAAAHRAVAPYIHAQLKQVELTGADGGAIEFRHTLLDRIMKTLDHTPIKDAVLVEEQGG